MDEVRRDFGVRPLDALDPAALAAHLRIPVFGISGCEASLVTRFLGSSLRERFHAATVPVDNGVAIIHNDRAPVTRQRSNLAHELGHVLLEHDFFPINTEDGFERDSAVEREADWFGFALLITTEAALAIARIGIDVQDAADMLGISVQAMRYRLDVSGASIRARRERSRRS